MCKDACPHNYGILAWINDSKDIYTYIWSDENHDYSAIYDTVYTVSKVL